MTPADDEGAKIGPRPGAKKDRAWLVDDLRVAAVVAAAIGVYDGLHEGRLGLASLALLLLAQTTWFLAGAIRRIEKLERALDGGP